jgi:hypothetical protein
MESDLRQLRWALQALALSGSEQQLLFPDYTPTAVNLATDFDQSCAAARENHSDDLSPRQSEALAAIESKLADMSRDDARFDVDIWSDGALGTSDDWREVRRLATEALEAFDWPVEAPSRTSVPVE